MLSAEEIAQAVRRLAEEISEAYEGKKLLLVGVLKGAFVFLSDLARALRIPCQIEFMRAASYGDNTSGGDVAVIQDLHLPLSDYDVLVVEDILDSGRTLATLLRHLRAREPHSLALCAFLDKPERREVPVEADFVGLRIPDTFVVGYGLDYAEKYRGLPYIAKLRIEY